jgi:predicted transcriptional regulator
MVQMKSALAGIPASRAMLTDFRTLAPNDTLSHAVDLILAGSQQDFPVASNGQVVGVLTRGNLLTGLAQRGPETLVADVMQREFEVIDSHEMLEVAFGRLQTCQCQTVPVMHQGQLVGPVTQDNVGEFLMIHGALRTPSRQPI